ncbi:MAG: hypothetical protein AAFW47_02845 [Pseudomonadota bacterium]
MTQTELMLSVYLIMTGFVCSGVLSSYYQWMRSEPAGFAVNYETWLSGFGGVLFCAFAGPFIIMRNTLRGRRIEGRPVGWVVAASAIATIWSFCSGLIIVHFVLTITGSMSGVA